jgi:glycosyltransferase involved in cell wall biosynthesis
MAPRLLYLITQTELGGAQRYVLELAQAAQASFEVAVATGLGASSFVDTLEAHGISHFIVPSLVREISPATDLRCLRDLRSLYALLQPDLVHLNSTKAGVLGSLACGKAVRSVYTVHGWVFNEELPLFKKWLYINSERFSAHYLDRIIVLSHYDWERGAALGIARAKMKVIKNGIDPGPYMERNAARAELGRLCNADFSRRPLLLCIANFYATKGLRYLLDALGAVKPGDTCAVVLGDGELRGELEAQRKALGLEERVFLPGRVADAARLIKAADLFVLPSVKEGLPYVILEALHAGIAIVSSSVGGIPEILDSELVPPRDPGLLAAAINRQLSTPRLSGLPVPRFSAMRDQTFALYDEVLQLGPARAG